MSDLEGNCGVCGSKKVFIRGRWPKFDKRLICPTCAYEKLEQIREITEPRYGQAYSEPPYDCKGA